MIGAIRIILVVAAMVTLSLSLIPVQYVFLKLKNTGNAACRISFIAL